ncbi:TIGR04141 family sporadically distributed protein, partial [Rhodoplanes sp. SY1]|uniref:TIGR04141 family sporadically distributed protein n=1 Tax=Rhodoplanes sp. SY1 TaxID=3166646 RepID=UPI0038B5D019
GKWSVFRCLIGCLEDKEGTRFVLNEGHWYIPSDGIFGPVEAFFRDRKAESDPNLTPFLVKSWSKNNKSGAKAKIIPAYEPEEDYNKRIADETGYVLFDQKWHKSSSGEFSKLEVCDLYDASQLRMIHLKRTSRQPSMLSHLFEQGRRTADLWQRDDVRKQFIERVRADAGDERAELLRNAKPADITIEFAIADHLNNQGHHTIPFLAKLTFESNAREIEFRGFRAKIR